MTVIIKGEARFDEALKLDIVKANAAARRIVERGGLVIAREAQEKWRQYPGGRTVSQRTGRVYFKSTPPFQAIRPWPTQRTGNTKRSTKVQSVSAVSASAWMSTTGPSTQYAGFVEWGTRYINPGFPVLRPAVEDSAVEIQSIAEEEWAAAQGE